MLQEDDDGDEVVQELPIYLNHHPDLVLLQLPTRPREDTTLDRDEHEIGVYFKPTSRALRLDLSLDEVFTDERTAKQYAEASGSEELRLNMTSTAVPHQSSYMAAMLADGALHLTPVLETMQLRPSLDHVDKLSSKMRQSALAASASSSASSLLPSASATTLEGDASQMVTSGTEDEAGLSDLQQEVPLSRNSKRPSMAKTLTVGLVSQTDQMTNSSGTAGIRMALLKPLRDAEAEAFRPLTFHKRDSFEAQSIQRALQGDDGDVAQDVTINGV